MDGRDKTPNVNAGSGPKPASVLNPTDGGDKIPNINNPEATDGTGGSDKIIMKQGNGQ